MKKGSKDTHQQDYLDNTLENECIQNQYKADFGGYRPHFKGANQNILPNTWKTYVAIILLLFPCWIISTGLFVLATYWGTVHQESFTYTMLALLIATVVFIIILSYVGSLNRRVREMKYIQSKEKELEQIKKLVKEEQEAADRLLLSSRR